MIVLQQQPILSSATAHMGVWTRTARTLNRWSYGLPAKALQELPAVEKATSGLLRTSLKAVRTTLLSQDYASFPRIGNIRVPEPSIGTMSLVVWTVVGFRYLKGFVRAEDKDTLNTLPLETSSTFFPATGTGIKARLNQLKQFIAKKDLREEFDITMRDWPLLIFMYAQSPVEKVFTSMAEGIRGIRLRGATGAFIKARSELKDIYTLHNAHVMENLARVNPRGFKAAMKDLKVLCQEFPEHLEQPHANFEAKMHAVFSALKENSPSLQKTSQEAFEAFNNLMTHRNNLIQPWVTQMAEKGSQKMPGTLQRLQQMEHFLSRYAMVSQLFPRLASFALVSYLIGYVPTRFLRDKSTVGSSEASTGLTIDSGQTGSKTTLNTGYTVQKSNLTPAFQGISATPNIYTSGFNTGHAFQPQETPRMMMPLRQQVVSTPA